MRAPTTALAGGEGKEKTQSQSKVLLAPTPMTFLSLPLRGHFCPPIFSTFGGNLK